MKIFLKYAFPIVTMILLLVACWLSHQQGDISGQESAHIAQLLGVSDEFLRSACPLSVVLPVYSLLRREPCVVGEAAWVDAFDLCVLLGR